MRARAPGGDVILSVEDLAVHFPIGGGLFGGERRLLRALTASYLQLSAASASVWSANPVAASRRCAFDPRLQMPTRGRIVLDGEVVTGRHSGDRKPWPASCKWCFRIPTPRSIRQTVRRTLEDRCACMAVTAQSGKSTDGVAEMLRHVGLRPEQAGRYRMNSRAQRQRIGIARALILIQDRHLRRTGIALDVSIRAQESSSAAGMKETLASPTSLFSHDLGVVEAT